MCKLSTSGSKGWSKTAVVIDRLYRELREPMQITPLFLRAISIDTPDNILASTIEQIHQDKGPNFVRKGENAKPKITKAGTPTAVLLIHNLCICVCNNLLLYYSIQ